MAEHTFIEKAKDAKADSFWYKDAMSGDLLSVMDKTMAGESIFPDKTPEVKLGLSTSYELTTYEEHALSNGSSSKAMAYVGITCDGKMYWGAGVDADITHASVDALVTAINNSVNA